MIVYIHGGAYILGSPHQRSPSYFMDEDVIFVSISYRLGIFGKSSVSKFVAMTTSCHIESEQ